MTQGIDLKLRYYITVRTGADRASNNVMKLAYSYQLSDLEINSGNVQNIPVLFHGHMYATIGMLSLH